MWPAMWSVAFLPKSADRSCLRARKHPTFPLPGSLLQWQTNSTTRACPFSRAPPASADLPPVLAGGARLNGSGSNPGLKTPLVPPSQDVTHLEISVRLKPPSQAVAGPETDEREVPSATWHDLEARWQAILALEASMDALRANMEGLRGEMEAASA